MGFVAFINHAANFLYPALGLSIAVSLFSMIFKQNRPLVTGFIGFVAINFAVCAVTLIVGLIVFERDGKMATYGAMVAASATCAWVLRGLWRR